MDTTTGKNTFKMGLIACIIVALLCVYEAVTVLLYESGLWILWGVFCAAASVVWAFMAWEYARLLYAMRSWCKANGYVSRSMK